MSFPSVLVAATRVRGRIALGFAADVIVLDTDPFIDGPASLLDARVIQTIVAGRTRYEAEDQP